MKINNKVKNNNEGSGLWDLLDLLIDILSIWS